MTERMLMPVAAHLWLADQRGYLLFQRRTGTGFADGLWSVPAGHLEPGETLHRTCVREAMEEIGVELLPHLLAFSCIQQKLDTDGQNRLDVFFDATLPAGATPRIIEPDRCDALCWTHPATPPDPLVPYVASALASRGSGPGRLVYFGFEKGEHS